MRTSVNPLEHRGKTLNPLALSSILPLSAITCSHRAMPSVARNSIAQAKGLRHVLPMLPPLNYMPLQITPLPLSTLLYHLSPLHHHHHLNNAFTLLWTLAKKETQ